MLNPILIGPVSAIGGVSPYGACGLIAHRCGRLFPFGTLFVNVTGSFVIGFATVTAPEGRWIVSPSVRDFFMAGVCGGYTTFSPFNLQTLNPTQDEEWLYTCDNAALNPVLCLVAVRLGHSLLEKARICLIASYSI